MYNVYIVPANFFQKSTKHTLLRENKMDHAALLAALLMGDITVQLPAQESKQIPPPSTEADEVARALLQGQNVFLTGGAGTGKSYTTRWLIQHLQSQGKQVTCCATTGVAALLLPNGATLHSSLSLPFGEKLNLKQFAKRVLGKFKGKKESLDHVRILGTDILVIDETSMMSCHLLEMISIKCQIIRQNIEPFGGMTVLAVGDMLQLRPVKGRDSHPKDGMFAFESPIWQEMKFQMVNLTRVHRQANPEFTTMLNFIRVGKPLTPAQRLLLDRLPSEPRDAQALKIMIKRAHVIKINNDQLAQCAETCSFGFPTKVSTVQDHKDMLQALTTDIRTNLYMNYNDMYQTYAVGARVMNIVNFGGFYCNGDRGTVVGYTAVEAHQEETNFVRISAEQPLETQGSNGDFVVVRMDRTQQLVGIQPFPFTRENTHKQVKIKVWAYPLCLSWASTVNKVQGCTITGSVHIDCSMMDWIPGSFYVALSRATSLANVSLVNYKGTFCCDVKARRYYDQKGKWDVPDQARFLSLVHKIVNDCIDEYQLYDSGEEQQMDTYTMDTESFEDQWKQVAPILKLMQRKDSSKLSCQLQGFLHSSSAASASDSRSTNISSSSKPIRKRSKPLITLKPAKGKKSKGKTLAHQRGNSSFTDFLKKQ